MQCQGSIASHLRLKHAKPKIYGETYVVLDKFGEIIPKYAKRHKGSANEVRCLLCGKETTAKSICYHLKKHHNCGQIQGENYEIISESKPKAKEVKKSAALNQNFMEVRIPVTLVIPLVCGSVKIEQ
jgi:hypothetical protein